MKNKRYSHVLIILIFLSIFGCKENKNNYPNIILIMSDDQGWGDAGYQGHPELKTPNLDKMAANGLVFNRFYSAAPVCSPTRGSVLTGRHPYRYGIPFANRGHIKKEEILLPELLKTKGYLTGHFGKWHLGTMDPYVIESNRGGKERFRKDYSPPWENGYDVCFATESKVPTFDPMINPEHNVGGSNRDQDPGDAFGTYYWESEGCIATQNLEGDNSRVIMDRVLSFINMAVEDKTPFFTTVWFHTPHSPVIAGEKDRQKYAELSEDKQHYYGCITAMDEQIGRLRDQLREFGIAENTMIWFCSDNGPAAKGGGPGWEPGGRQQGVTGGLRGRKGTLFEGGVRVPGIIEWPAVIKKHRETDFPAVTSDYYPTITEILGIVIEDQPVLDGISLKKIIENEDIRERSKPIGFQSRFADQNWKVWNDNKYKLIVQEDGEEYFLFNLENDREEKENLADLFPEVVKNMETELDTWLKSVESSNKGDDYQGMEND